MPSAPPFPAWRAVAEEARSYLASAKALNLLDVWLAAGTGRQPPGRRDLKPEAMAPILPDIWLMDYLPHEARLRYRLEGGNIRARYDFSLVGKHLDEIIAPEARERVLSYFLACVARPAVCMVAGRLYHEWRQPGYGERLLLPLFGEDGKPEGLIGITDCKQTFPDRSIAEKRVKRITYILPLDGSEAEEEAS